MSTSEYPLDLSVPAASRTSNEPSNKQLAYRPFQPLDLRSPNLFAQPLPGFPETGLDPGEVGRAAGQSSKQLAHEFSRTFYHPEQVYRSASQTAKHLARRPPGFSFSVLDPAEVGRPAGHSSKQLADYSPGFPETGLDLAEVGRSVGQSSKQLAHPQIVTTFSLALNAALPSFQEHEQNIIPVISHFDQLEVADLAQDSANETKCNEANGKYPKRIMDDVIDQIRKKVISIYGASRDYKIPRSTLQYRLSKRCKGLGKTGPPTVLSPTEESKLEEWLFDMQRKGFPITSAALQDKVAEFIKSSPRPNPFRDNIPGKNWLAGFFKRHQMIVSRTPEGVSAASARVSEQDIRGWFRTVLAYGEEHPEVLEAMLDPSRNVNGDEIGFYMFKCSKKVLARKGSRDVMMVESGDPKKNVTVLFCFSADGYQFPPVLVLPYKRIPKDVVQSVPGSWGLGSSKRGWMDTDNFTKYIKQILYPSLVKRGVKFPVLFYVDGHKSHTAFAAAEACLELGIILIALYPNSTRIIQPADVGIFGPLKTAWRKNLERLPPTDPVTARNFAGHLQQAMNDSFKPETIIKAFAVCGLHTFDENSPNYKKCLGKATKAPGNVMDPPEDSPNNAPVQDVDVDMGDAEDYLDSESDCEESDENPENNVIPFLNVTNTRQVDISDFLQTPPTPQRTKKHINYSIRSNPVLTAEDRLADIRRVEEEKEQIKQRRIENSKKREEARKAKESEKQIRSQERQEKKENRLKLKENEKEKREQARLAKEEVKNRREHEKEEEKMEREENRKRKAEEKLKWKELNENLKKRKTEQKKDKLEAKKIAANSPDVSSVYVRLR